MTASIDIFVRGIPAPQGSKRHVGRGIMVESSAKVKPWRDAVRSTIAEAWAHGMIDGPVRLRLEFVFPRPRGHYGAGRNSDRLKPSAPTAPIGPPDLDKLERATLDGITAAGVWRDDSRVVSIRSSKVYCGFATWEHPGARIVIEGEVSRG